MYAALIKLIHYDCNHSHSEFILALGENMTNMNQNSSFTSSDISLCPPPTLPHFSEKEGEKERPFVESFAILQESDRL